MLVYANSYGSHHLNHRDLNDPRKNKKFNPDDATGGFSKKH